MKIEEVLQEAYRLTTPDREEEKELRETAHLAKKLIREIIENNNIEADVDVYGSAARSTWLPGQRDIDVFVVIHNRDVKLEDVLKILVKNLREVGVPISLRYAQHPYLTARIGRYEVDVVPCYKIAMGERPLTAADRTPLHHQFLIERLNEEMKRDVRVLKLFLRGVGIYGAEIKIEGFSGYLTELLVAYYGSFLNVLRAAANWRPFKTYITFGDGAKFRAPLVFIDPVDPSRNAAAAVSLTSMSTFILASRRFLKRPSISYFTPSTKSALMLNTVEVVFTYPQEPPEVVWGRFKKRGRSLYKWLRECGFKVYRWGVESDDETYVALVYVVESVELPPYILHRGPPVYDDAVDVFVEKYLGEDVVGPFVQGSRVYIIKRRKYTHISECIEKHLGRRDYRIELNKYRGPLVQKNPWIT